MATSGKYRADSKDILLTQIVLHIGVVFRPHGLSGGSASPVSVHCSIPAPAIYGTHEQ
jgi:hypothetical protein